MDKIKVISKDFFIKTVNKDNFNPIELFSKNSFLHFYIHSHIKINSLIQRNQLLLKRLGIKLYGFIDNHTFLLNLKTIKYE